MSKMKSAPADPPEVIELFEAITKLFPKAGGFEGLIVPSARRKVGKNIVIFPSRLAKIGKIEVLGVDQLPK